MSVRLIHISQNWLKNEVRGKKLDAVNKHDFLHDKIKDFWGSYRKSFKKDLKRNVKQDVNEALKEHGKNYKCLSFIKRFKIKEEIEKTFIELFNRRETAFDEGVTIKDIENISYSPVRVSVNDRDLFNVQAFMDLYLSNQFLQTDSPYLEDKAKKNISLKNLRKDSFKPDMVKEFWYIRKKIERCVLKTNIQKNFVKQMLVYSNTFDYDSFNPQKKAEFEKSMKSIVRNLQKKRKKAFDEGKTLFEIEKIMGDNSNVIFTPQDFGKHWNFSDKAIEFARRSDKINAKRQRKIWLDAKEKQNLTVEAVNTLSEEHRLQLREFFQASLQKGVSLDKLNDSEIPSYLDSIKKSQNEQLREKAKNADIEAQKLIEQEKKEKKLASVQQQGKKRASRKNKKRQITKKPSTPSDSLSQKPRLPTKVVQAALPSDLKQRVARLNNVERKSIYRLHSRIIRWNTTDLSKIQYFSDFIIGVGPVHQYQTDSPDQKKYWRYMRDIHNLMGIERILSDTILSNMFSAPYSFVDRNKIERQGRVISAKMITNGEIKSGLIHAGIKDCEIYHLTFNRLFEKVIKISDIVKPLDGYDAVNESLSTDWELTKSCVFSLIDDYIEMQIGIKPEDRVIFHLKAIN